MQIYYICFRNGRLKIAQACKSVVIEHFKVYTVGPCFSKPSDLIDLCLIVRGDIEDTLKNVRHYVATLSYLAFKLTSSLLHLPRLFPI